MRKSFMLKPCAGLRPITLWPVCRVPTDAGYISTSSSGCKYRIRLINSKIRDVNVKKITIVWIQKSCPALFCSYNSGPLSNSNPALRPHQYLTSGYTHFSLLAIHYSWKITWKWHLNVCLLTLLIHNFYNSKCWF